MDSDIHCAWAIKLCDLVSLQVPSLAAALRCIAGRCLPLPRVPAAAVAAAAAEGAGWRDIEAALRALGGIEGEAAGPRQSL